MVTFPVRKVLKQLEDKILKLLSESSGTWVAHVAPGRSWPPPPMDHWGMGLPNPAFLVKLP